MLKSIPLPDHGPGCWIGNTDANGHGLFRVCQRWLSRQPLVDHPNHRPKGKLLVQSEPLVPDDSVRAIDARNAFVMSSLLQEVTRSGTAASAQATLKRPDLYGKTGTTNDSMDAWFAGYQPTLAAVTWIGYDTPENWATGKPAGFEPAHLD